MTPLRPKAKKRRERDIQKAILALRIPGLVLFKTGAGAFRVNGRFVRMGHKGVSDLVGWYQRKIVQDHRHFFMAQFCAVEVKAEGKKPTPEQAAFLQHVRDAGGIAIVAYSTEDVINALR